MPAPKNETKMELNLALDRGIRILELLSEHNSLSLNELHQLTGVGKASLMRLCYTLVCLGYVNKDEVTGNYSLTMKLYELGMRTVRNVDKMSVINSALTDLNRSTGRIAQFSVEDNNSLLCLQSIDQNNNLFASVYTSRGGRSPLYCTSAGKAILSTYSNTAILEKFDHMDVRPLTKNTITDAQALLEDIVLTRQRGYALDLEENEPGLCCIGTIVLGQSGQPVGAVSLSGSVFKDKSEIDELAGILLPAVARLSGMMGYIKPL